MTRIPIQERKAEKGATAGEADSFEPGIDSANGPLPLMSPFSERMAEKSGAQKNWQRDDAIRTHEWSSKYGVPFPKQGAGR